MSALGIKLTCWLWIDFIVAAGAELPINSEPASMNRLLLILTVKVGHLTKKTPENIVQNECPTFA